MADSVKGFGYAVIGSPDIDAWKRFGSDLLGLQVASQTDDRLLLRMDDFAYRIDVRADGPRGVNTFGWDAGGHDELVGLTKKLQDAGFEVSDLGAEVAKERQVRELVRFRDPDGTVDVELFWGLHRVAPPFVSPIGAHFVTKADDGSNMGLGHALQIVSDVETYKRLYLDVFGFRVSDWVQVPGDENLAHFSRCNQRHHSLAFTESGVRPTGVAHLMWEVDDLDALGRIYDAALDSEFPILSTFGKHTNDKMISFYVGGPGGVGIEFGYGGLQVSDEDNWQPSRYDAAHYWGHQRTGNKPPA